MRPSVLTWTVAAMATAVVWALGGSALAAAPPSPQDLWDACVRVETPRVLARVGLDPRVPSREKAAEVVALLCSSLARDCEAQPQGDNCRDALANYGLGTPGHGRSAQQQLFEAAFQGRLAEVQRLLSEPVDVNGANALGWTPLMMAAAENHLPVVQALLNARADPDRRNALGRTALMFAAGYGFEPIAQALLAAGADPNLAARDAQGWTALHRASANGHAGVVDMLLQAGADPGRLDHDGRTAQDMASQQGHAPVVERLHRAMGGGA